MAMTINRLITILALLCIALGVEAKKKQEYPHAEIKVCGVLKNIDGSEGLRL